MQEDSNECKVSAILLVSKRDADRKPRVSSDYEFDLLPSHRKHVG